MKLEQKNLHIKKNQIERRALNGSDGLGAMTTLAYDFDKSFLAQHAQQPLTSERFIINNQGTEYHGVGLGATRQPSSD